MVSKKALSCRDCMWYLGIQYYGRYYQALSHVPFIPIQESSYHITHKQNSKVKIFNSNEQDSPGACIYVGTTGNIYVETLQGDLVFIESVPAGDIIPVMVQKVLVGAAANAGSPNTLTSAGELIAYF